MIARSAWSCALLTGTPIHSPGTEEAFPTSQHPQALFQRSLSAPPTGDPREVASAGKVQPQLYKQPAASRYKARRGRGERASRQSPGSRDLTALGLAPGAAAASDPGRPLFGRCSPAHPPFGARIRLSSPKSRARRVCEVVGRRERCRPHRAGGSRGLYTSPAAAIGAAASLSLPPCLSTALRGVKATASWFLAGVVEPQSTRPENLAPGRHCEVTATGTLPSAPYGASPDTRWVRAATSAAHLKEVLGGVPSLPPARGPTG